LVRPETVIGLDVPVPVIAAPAVQLAVYPVIVAPPFDDGAVKAMLALAFPAVAVPIVGAPGTVTVVPPPDELVVVPVLPSLPQADRLKMVAAPATKTMYPRTFIITDLRAMCRLRRLSGHCGGNVGIAMIPFPFFPPIFDIGQSAFAPKCRHSVSSFARRNRTLGATSASAFAAL
jgi:hypothetical protein